MEFLLFILILFLVIYFFNGKTSVSLQQKEKELPFKKKDFLLNTPERIFFEELQKIIPNNYIVLPQIVLSSIVRVVSGQREFWSYQNKINRKTIDFVIFEKQYLKPVIAIEYDGKTHNKPDRQERDLFVNQVLNSAGIKIVHIRHQNNINFDEIKNMIAEIDKKI